MATFGRVAMRALMMLMTLLIATGAFLFAQTPFPKRPGEFAAIFLVANFALPVEASAQVVQPLRWKTMVAPVY